jgi:hypothetical protein
LLAVSNQGNGTFDSNLQVVLSIGQRKVFLGKEMPDKLGEDLWLRLLREEMGEEARKRGSRIGNIGARQIPCNSRMERVSRRRSSSASCWVNSSPILPAGAKWKFINI